MTAHGRHTRVHFLPVRVGAKTNTREEQQQIAEARAHAASVSHDRRRELNRAGSGVKMPRRLSSRDSGTIKDRDLAHYEALPKLYLPVESGSSGKLDPFLNLATALSKQDRNLVHLYLTSVPGRLYGTAATTDRRPYLCPVRDFTIPQMATSEIFVLWIVFVAEMMTVSASGPEGGDMLIAARRASIYQRMRAVMADTDNWDRSSTALSLVGCAIAEARAGDSKVAKTHLQISLELLRRRGGLPDIQDMEFPRGMIILNAFTNIELPLFESRGGVEDALTRCRDTMSLVTSRKLVETIPSSLKDYFDRPGAIWRPQLANLHLLRCVLARTNVTEQREYLGVLQEMIKGSQTSGILSAMAITFILCASAARMNWWKLHSGVPLKSWETIELVALMEMAPIGRRKLSNFLCFQGGMETMLGFEIKPIEDEILRSWDSRQASLVTEISPRI